MSATPLTCRSRRPPVGHAAHLSLMRRICCSRGGARPVEDDLAALVDLNRPLLDARQGREPRRVRTKVVRTRILSYAKELAGFDLDLVNRPSVWPDR
jgi:hypothetical protein